MKLLSLWCVILALLLAISVFVAKSPEPEVDANLDQWNQVAAIPFGSTLQFVRGNQVQS